MVSTPMRASLFIIVFTGAVGCAAALPVLPADDAPASALAAAVRSAAAEARKPSPSACTEVPSRGDVSWIQAYNAAWVRIKANGALAAALDDAAPGLLQFVSFIADCPAVPEAYPFPCRKGAKRLNRVLKRKKVVVALQDLGPGLAAFTAAFKAIDRALASEIAAAYGVDLGVEFAVYPDSNSAVTAVIEGAADCTDPFYRQWTLVGVYPRQVQRRVEATPACTMWAASLSLSWNKTRDGWSSLDDLRAAGPAVVVPLYSSMFVFRAEVRNILPRATLIARPEQNFETDVTQLNAVLTEFHKGGTTALLASKGDLAGVIDRANLDFEFNLDDVATVQAAQLSLPVGAWLPLPGN